MSANETVHVSATGGQKAGNDERYDLIPTEPLRRLAIHAGEVAFAGAGGSYHQMMSHAWAFWAGEQTDQLTDWDHLTAAAWEAFRIVQPNWRPPTWVLDDRRPGRERYDRIPPDALRQLAKHFGVGAKKYADDNWTRGYDWRLTFAAANRHAEQWRAGEEIDPETGSNHLIAFAWHMLVLDEFTRINRDGDTRYCTKVRKWLDAEKRWKQTRGWTTGLVSVEEIAKRIGIKREHLAPPPPRLVEVKFTGGGGGGGVANAPTRTPRVVDRLSDNERDAEWTGKVGRYRWDDEHGRWQRRSRTRAEWMQTVCTSRDYGPYTEVLPPAPRVVQQLGDNERDAHSWRDRDGDEWTWRGRGWHFRRNETGGDWISIGVGGTVSGHFAPFTEVLA